MKRILLSTMLLAAVSANVFAGGKEDIGTATQHAEPTAASMQAGYEPAVKEGQWTITPRVGIEPTSSKDARITRTFTDTTPGQAVTLPAGNQNVTDNTFVRRSYDAKPHNLPRTFAIDLGYAPMDNVEVFFGFDYAKASGKKHTAIRQYFERNTTTTNIKTNLVSKYKQSALSTYGFHLGGRYFFDLDSKFSPFVGAKLGLVHRSHGKHKVKDVVTNYRTNIATGITNNNADVHTASYKLPLYKNSTGFSGGLQAGFDYRISQDVSLVAMAEAVASTSIKTDKKAKLVYRVPGAGSNRTVFSKVTRSPKTSFSFPITAGIKIRM